MTPLTPAVPNSIVVPGSFGETPDWLIPAISLVHSLSDSWHHETGCKVLLAVDAGSRARGLAGPTSDLDVRLVYLPPRAWYYSVDRKALKDTITRHDFEAAGIMVPEGTDLVGYELMKFLGLVRGSNPTALEILGSSVVYLITSIGHDLKALRDMPHKRQALVGHYASQAITQVARDKLLTEPATVKAWLMFLVPALSSLWAASIGKPPPLGYGELLDASLIPDDCMGEAFNLGQAKRNGDGAKVLDVGSLPNLSAWAKQFTSAHPRPERGMMTSTHLALIDAVTDVSRRAAALS